MYFLYSRPSQQPWLSESMQSTCEYLNLGVARGLEHFATIQMITQKNGNLGEPLTGVPASPSPAGNLMCPLPFHSIWYDINIDLDSSLVGSGYLHSPHYDLISKPCDMYLRTTTPTLCGTQIIFMPKQGDRPVYTFNWPYRDFIDMWYD
jgi:hypothetical protein